MQRPDLETGTILNTHGAWATVITNKSKSCKECGKAQAGICGKSGAGMVIKVRNPAGALKGDTVELGLDKVTHIKAYFLAFILPVLILFICTYIGSIISLSTGIKSLDVIAGFTGLIISIIFSFKKIRKLDRTSRLQVANVLYDPPEYVTTVSAEEMDYMAAFDKVH
ncbi:MAG: SoxR reducing system RseC family protein [Nitrospirae bacterium]|nr:SoxR reducing system RseC family protein [Nitrospirota bacterium]